MALSGGVDSVALLLALQQLRRRSARWRRFALRAVHINHQLRPAARSWEQHCRRLCAALKVPLVVRLEGTNVAEARLILDAARAELPTMQSATDLAEAARKVCAAVS